MKRILTSEIVTRLNGHPIRLSSPYAEGQLLSVNKEGEISLEDSGASEFDQYWKLMPERGGFEIVSSQRGFKICHHMENGGVVTAIKQAHSQGGCVWKVGKEGEIYQPSPDGNERYLWLAGSHLYATKDGFLAENWAPYLFGEKLPPPVGPQYGVGMLLIMVALIILLGFFFLKK